LKLGYGVKNAAVGFSWGFAVAFSLDNVSLEIFAFFFLKLFVNSAYFDLRDVKRDRILTLSKLLKNKFRIFLSFVNLLNHLFAFSVFEHILIISSFALTQLALLLEEKTGGIIIDSEATLSVFAS